MKPAFVAVLVVAALFMTSPLLVSASQPDPEDVIDFRQSVYNVIGWHFRPLGDMAKGDIEFDPALAAKNSRIVAQMSHVAPGAFLSGSDQGETRAKSEIWSDRDGFDSAMQLFQDEAAKLAEVAKDGNFRTFRAQVGETGKSCKNCHDDFRKKRD